MGGKHSKGSDQGTPPNDALNIQGDESDYEEATRLPTEEETPEEKAKNPLHVPELLEQVVEHIKADTHPRANKKQTLAAIAKMSLSGNPSFFPEAINKPVSDPGTPSFSNF